MGKFKVGDKVIVKTNHGKIGTFFERVPCEGVVLADEDEVYVDFPLEEKIVVRADGLRQTVHIEAVDLLDERPFKDYTPKGIEEVDNVNHPQHYNNGKVECIEAMEAMSRGSKVDTHTAYLWQNAFKYLWRWPYKNGKEDLKKAVWYINRIIERENNG